jgi:hypothetical protein
MVKIFGEHYYLDLDEIEKYVEINTTLKSEKDGDSSETHVNVVKYELLKNLLDVLFTESDEVDEKMGINSSEISIPFKLAFNTLLNKKLLKHY